MKIIKNTCFGGYQLSSENHTALGNMKQINQPQLEPDDMVEVICIYNQKGCDVYVTPNIVQSKADVDANEAYDDMKNEELIDRYLP